MTQLISVSQARSGHLTKLCDIIKLNYLKLPIWGGGGISKYGTTDNWKCRQEQSKDMGVLGAVNNKTEETMQKSPGRNGDGQRFINQQAAPVDSPTHGADLTHAKTDIAAFPTPSEIAGEVVSGCQGLGGIKTGAWRTQRKVGKRWHNAK